MFHRRFARMSRILLLAAGCAALLVAALPAKAAPLDGKRNQFASPRFEQVWRGADLPVQQGQSTRSWTWGPQPWFDYKEVYKQSPSGLRLVQYYDKARMEINNPANTGGPLGGVTNGLLVVEMVSGRIKLGEGIGPEENQPFGAAAWPVAGDLFSSSTPTPAYYDFAKVATTDNGYRDPNRSGQRAGATMRGNGFYMEPTIGTSQPLANLPGTEIVAYDDVTGHNVPRVFDDFRNAGPVPAIVAFGHPITDAYWVKANLGGREQDVLVQLFERRTLTYTPSNPPAFRVEMGNVGQHYFLWRYNGRGHPWSMGDLPSPIFFASKREGPDFRVYTMNEHGDNQAPTANGEAGILPFSASPGWYESGIVRVFGAAQRSLPGRRLLWFDSLGGSATVQERFGEWNDDQPAVSPDGQQVAFVSDRDGNPELFLTDAGRRLNYRTIRLTETEGCSNGHPSWLPDGSGLIYESNCQDGRFQIYRANLSYTTQQDVGATVSRLISPRPGEAERLTNTSADERWPRVSPDGSRIAFFSIRDGNSEIYTMSIDGGRQTRLTDNPAADEGPAWSPDGGRLVFNSNRDGDHEIFVMNADGSGQTQLTNNTVDDGYAVWGS